MRTITLAFALLGALSLGGCAKQAKSPGFSAEDLATNPAANFQEGLFKLQNPDRRTGEVDYEAAYNFFVASQNLGGGAKAAFNAGWTAEALGNIDAAEEHYRAAYEADPDDEKVLYSLSRILTEQGKAAAAVELFAGHAQKHPDNLEIRNDYLAALVAAKRYDDAIAEAQEILRKDPKNAAVYRNLSALYYSQGNYSMSQLTGEKALELNDGDPGVYNNMGVTHLIQGDEPAAIEKFKTAIQLDGKNFEANMNLGFIALNSGDYALATQCFEAASEANPASLDAKLGLAVARRGTGDFKAAGTLYDQIIQNDPKNKLAYYNAAALHEFYTKDFKKALSYINAYKTAHSGTIGPTHEVFQLEARIQQAQQAEEARLAQIAAQKKAEEERRKRNEAMLAEMATMITEAQAVLAKHGANEMCLDPMQVEEYLMILEQAQMVVEAGDADMAGDIRTLLDGYLPPLYEHIASHPDCAEGGGAPAQQQDTGAPTVEEASGDAEGTDAESNDDAAEPAAEGEGADDGADAGEAESTED